MTTPNEWRLPSGFVQWGVEKYGGASVYYKTFSYLDSQASNNNLSKLFKESFVNRLKQNLANNKNKKEIQL